MMLKHSKFNEVKSFVDNNIPVLLHGESGCGKSTLLIDVCKELGYEYRFIAGSAQTTVGHFLGFTSVTGEYIPTMFREAVENGYMFSIEEIDGMQPNTLLILNSLENGVMAFPDKVVHVHPNFRLVATANTVGNTEHSTYTGRSKLDFATTDRFMLVSLTRDNSLEESLTNKATKKLVDSCREFLVDNGVTEPITMRDSLRYHKVSQLKLLDNPVEILFKGSNSSWLDMYIDNNKEDIPVIKNINDMNANELWNIVNKRN